MRGGGGGVCFSVLLSYNPEGYRTRQIFIFSFVCMFGFFFVFVFLREGVACLSVHLFVRSFVCLFVFFNCARGSCNWSLAVSSSTMSSLKVIVAGLT